MCTFGKSITGRELLCPTLTNAKTLGRDTP
jgi:hypothetical protein